VSRGCHRSREDKARPMRMRAGPRTSLTAAGAVAEPPCAVGAELTGGATPSASRSERGEEGLTSGTHSSVTT